MSNLPNIELLMKLRDAGVALAQNTLLATMFDPSFRAFYVGERDSLPATHAVRRRIPPS